VTDEAAARERRSSRRWSIAGLVATVAVGALVVLGAGRPADPYLAGAGAGTLTGEFRSVSFTITGPRAKVAPTAERCAFLAETEEQQHRGLMNSTSLEGRDGMLFRFTDDVTTGFIMKETPLPLSIAWFDADGSFVSATDMEPCLGQPACQTYAAARPYRYALEVPQGRLPDLGALTGARLAVGGPCG